MTDDKNILHSALPFPNIKKGQTITITAKFAQEINDTIADLRAELAAIKEQVIFIDEGEEPREGDVCLFEDGFIYCLDAHNKTNKIVEIIQRLDNGIYKPVIKKGKSDEQNNA